MSRGDVSKLENWITLGKVDHTYINASHLEKWFTHRKMGHTLLAVVLKLEK